MANNLRSGEDLLKELAEKYNVELEVVESIVRDTLDAICESLGLPKTEKYMLNLRDKENRDGSYSK